MSLNYLQAQNTLLRRCKCRAHSQHLVFRYLWNHPVSDAKSAARELHMSHCHVRQAKARLHKRNDLNRRCPECFEPALEGGACRNCGFEVDKSSGPLLVDFNSRSPNHTIHPMNGLGSQTDYEALRLQYGGRNIAHLVERPQNPLLEKCKSELWGALKEIMPPDGVVAEATRILTKEVREFEHRYPALKNSTNAKRQLVDNVLKLMAFRYPGLRKLQSGTRTLELLGIDDE